MESYSEIYKYLTGVDINKERAIWDERGKGYYGEFLVFCELLKSLPDPSKILMNLHVPTASGNTTEIDLIAITSIGIIVYEIKHYKGTIYGSGEGKIWTQYFRTQPNHTFQNPIAQNAYHCKALHDLTQMPVRSVVVFTNNECDLRLNNIFIPVCRLNDVAYTTQNIIRTNNATYSIEEIDNTFKKLALYSNMTVPVSSARSSNLAFCDWIYLYHDAFIKLYKKNQVLIEEENTRYRQQHDAEITDLKQKNEKAHKGYKTRLKATFLTGVIAIPTVIILLLSIGIPTIINNKSYYDSKLNDIEQNYAEQLSINEKKNKASVDSIQKKYNDSLKTAKDNYNSAIESMQAELDEMNSKFEKVEKYNNIPLSSIITVSELSFEKSAVNNTIINYVIELTDDFYNVQFHGNSKFMVGLKDGSVKEYPALQEDLRKYNTTTDMWLYAGHNKIKSLPMLLTGIIPEEISYVKLTNGWLYKWNKGNPILIEKNEELLLYDAG